MLRQMGLFELQINIEWGWYWLVTENKWEVASSSAIMKSLRISPIHTLSCWSVFRSSTFLDRRMFRNRNACWLTRFVSTFSASCVPSDRTISSSSPDKAMGGPQRRIVWGEVTCGGGCYVAFAWLLRYLVHQYLPLPIGYLMTVFSVSGLCSVKSLICVYELKKTWKFEWRVSVTHAWNGISRPVCSVLASVVARSLEMEF
jgi:hypothetical protein